MLIYAYVNCAFSTIYALSHTQLKGFATASQLSSNDAESVLLCALTRRFFRLKYYTLKTAARMVTHPFATLTPGPPDVTYCGPPDYPVHKPGQPGIAVNINLNTSTLRLRNLIDHLRWAWPDVRWESGANFATQQGVFAAAFIVCIECTKIGLSLLTVRPVIDAVNVIGAVAYTLVAYGIHRRSRIAAMFGLALYLTKTALGLVLYLMAKADLPAGADYPLWMLQLVMMVMFVNAVRGTIAYRRYHKAVTR